jgi:hypothetical protein
MKSTWQPRKLQGDRVSIQRIEAETLVYDELTHRAWCLNLSSACVWQLCDGRRTLDEIRAAAGMELGSAVTEDLLLLAMAELEEKGLLENSMAEALPRDASRRQLIGRMGLAAAALLPVVAAIAAPPALAQSGSTGTGDAVSREQKRRALAARSAGSGSAPEKQDKPSDPYTQ